MKLQEFICERDGKFSASRLQFHVWNIAILTMWIVTCIKQGAMAPIDNSLVMLLGFNTGGFVVHRFAEKSGEKTNG